MNPQQILDDTITEEPPPFRSIADLMARERRRARGRRLAAVTTGVAGVLGVAFGTLAATGVIAPARTVTGTGAAPTATADYGTNMAACLSGKGWDVVRTSDGGFETRSGIPQDEVDAFHADVATCMARFGYDRPLVVTPEMAGAFYDKLLASAACLRELGYDVPEPPSRESYIQTLVDGGLPEWYPYFVLHQSYGAAYAACPPPTSW